MAAGWYIYAEALQYSFVGDLIDFCKALDSVNVRHSVASFDMGEAAVSDPVMLVARFLREFAREILNLLARESSFFA